jgi:nicotinamidase-related amidase
MASPFHTEVDLRYTALLLPDIQSEILARFPADKREQYLSEVLSLIKLFRDDIHKRRTTPAESQEKAGGAYVGIPLIIHHVLPFGYNNNAFISPYNKLSSWVKFLQEKGLFSVTEKAKNPETPVYSIPEALYPQGGSFGGSNIDEILLPKFQTSSFGSSDLLGYLRARGIRHVVLCGLTTVGAILGSARHGADLDYHVIIPRSGVMDDEDDVNDFILQRVLPKFVDIVDMKDLKDLFTATTD